jgi:putative transcriptional regulator
MLNKTLCGSSLPGSLITIGPEPWQGRKNERTQEIAMSTLGKRLIKGAKEALAIARGEADRSTYRVHVPAEVNVKSIRRRLKLTQDEFSRRFAIPQVTLRDWEQGRRHPEGPHSMIFDRGTASSAAASPLERVPAVIRSSPRKRGSSLSTAPSGFPHSRE